VLPAILVDERHLYGLVPSRGLEPRLRPEHFYREQHGEVFAAMLRLHENDRKIDR
jgi:replicative DNA helicase